MYDLLITELADEDLDAIVQYISFDLSNPVAAKNLLDKLEAVYQFLVSSPQMYPVCDDDRLKGRGYRKVLLKNYILIFRVDEAISRVYLLRFFYGPQNYIELL